MKIEFIQYPFAFTDEGHRVSIDTIHGIPRVGSELVVRADGDYDVKASTNDSECVNGVCPVK